MINPYKLYQNFVKKTPRNSFDLSHLNNLTLPFGLLVPDLVLDVTSGDSAEIDAAFALNFLPMMFPIQTPVRINQYFFYVRYRNCMDNYEDFRYGNKSGIVHPYLKQPASFFKTCGLADYMGIPTTLAVGEHGYLAFMISGTDLAFGALTSDNSGASSSNLQTGTSWSRPLVVDGSSQTIGTSGQVGARSFSRNFPVLCTNSFSSYTVGRYLITLVRGMDAPYSSTAGYYIGFSVLGLDYPLYHDDNHCYLSFTLYLDSTAASALSAVRVVPSYRDRILMDPIVASSINYDSTNHILRFDLSAESVDALNVLLESVPSYDLLVVLEGVTREKYNTNSCFSTGKLSAPITATRPVDIGEHPELNPFCSVGGNDPVLRINALPFRAYEQIYNAYFRNERVEPFMKNGEVEYNDFGTTYADGADTTPYRLMHRNWELDALTSCLKTPQQGTAPIVGVDGRRITFSDGDNNYNFIYQTDNDGRLIAEGSRFEEETVPGSVRSGAVDLIANGFTIEQLREGNAMTLWVEKNIRRGLRYRDQLKAHTGIDLDYDELELPEFLGGFSHYMDVQSVTASAGTDATVLGDIAGKGSAFKKASHKISHFFREDGVVIGLICIVPQPVYSQTLSKFYLRTSALDYYNSEFSHLGMQPVPYSEVAPVQMYNEMSHGGERTMQTPFGYNRPNYDMVSMSDEVHGYMRTTDKDFVLMRTFDGVPELGASFLHVDGKQLNDVFTVKDDNGHIARGQVGFRIFMKRPVPTVGEPRLE